MVVFFYLQLKIYWTLKNFILIAARTLKLFKNWIGEEFITLIDNDTWLEKNGLDIDFLLG